MPAATFDFMPLLPAGLPVPAVKWAGFPKYNFSGGHNDADTVPVEGLVAAAADVIRREGKTLATYGLASGAQGYRPLREFLATKLKTTTGIVCTADDILITGGSNQGIELVSSVLLAPGDTIFVEQQTYGGALNRFNKRNVKIVGMPLDGGGIRMDALASMLDEHKKLGIRPKLIYTIPTVQNPTATVMPEDRRRELLRLSLAYSVPILEDDCYADLTWDGSRPRAIYAMSEHGGVLHIGSFSKSISPALRVGFVVVPTWDLLSRMLPFKTDGGTGALDQMVLAEYCNSHFAAHVQKLRGVLRSKLDALKDALAEHFGTTAEFDDPKGGIFLWIKLPDVVDTQKLALAARAAGIELNPGPEWSTDKAYARPRLRLCFANPSKERIREGVGVLAEICRKEFGVPTRIANVKL
jgi:2-aminoadipate transaminase